MAGNAQGGMQEFLDAQKSLPPTPHLSKVPAPGLQSVGPEGDGPRHLVGFQELHQLGQRTAVGRGSGWPRSSTRRAEGQEARYLLTWGKRKDMQEQRQG